MTYHLYWHIIEAARKERAKKLKELGLTKLTMTPCRFDEVVGTCFQAELSASFDEIVDIFGTPTRMEPDGKTNCEWYVKINGTPVTIYDWKQDSVDVKDVTSWHVGGHSETAWHLVIEAMVSDPEHFEIFNVQK